MDDLTRQLNERFGFATFRPGQEDVIRAVLAGRDAMAVMPTGQGKSLCYQLPATLLPGLTLVISPLIALMQDQVTAMRQRKIAAAAFRNGQWDLRWIDAGSGATGIISPSAAPHIYVRYPAWSPKNDLVVYERGELRGNVWMLQVAGK